MKVRIGKILIRFTKAQIEGHDIRRGLVIVNHKNPGEYSIEKGIVEAVNSKQHFFKVGDTVLVNYQIFMDGRSKMTKTPSRRVMELPGGDGIYHCSDGTDGFNDSDVYARLDDDGGWIPYKNLVQLTPPPAQVEKLGSLYLPATGFEAPPEAAGASEKPKWRKVLAVSPFCEIGLAAGDVVLCQDYAFEVQVHEPQGQSSFYFIKENYLLLKKDRPELEAAGEEDDEVWLWYKP